MEKAGRGNKSKAALLTDEEIDLLYENNMLGLSSAESLLNTVWHNNTIHFGIRGCQEHRDLCWGDVKLSEDANGNEQGTNIQCTLRHKQKRGLVLTPPTSERFRQKCSRLALNEIP